MTSRRRRRKDTLEDTEWTCIGQPSKCQGGLLGGVWVYVRATLGSVSSEGGPIWFHAHFGASLTRTLFPSPFRRTPREDRASQGAPPVVSVRVRVKLAKASESEEPIHSHPPSHNVRISAAQLEIGTRAPT